MNTQAVTVPEAPVGIAWVLFMEHLTLLEIVKLHDAGRLNDDQMVDAWADTVLILLQAGYGYRRA